MSIQLIHCCVPTKQKTENNILAALLSGAQDYRTNCEDEGMGWDRMAIMMISQCDKTRKVA